ncbi:hypothetical protein GCM10010295_62690 [Streptomyces intermedius]
MGPAPALVDTYRAQGSLYVTPTVRPFPSGSSDASGLTPDELSLVGPAAGVPGLWCAEASWVTHAGGVGRQLAHQFLRVGEPLVDPERLAPTASRRGAPGSSARPRSATTGSATPCTDCAPGSSRASTDERIA